MTGAMRRRWLLSRQHLARHAGPVILIAFACCLSNQKNGPDCREAYPQVSTMSDVPTARNVFFVGDAAPM